MTVTHNASTAVRFNSNLFKALTVTRGELMVWLTERKPKLAIQSLVEQIIAAGQMSREEHFQLTSAMLSDQRITYDERRQINQVFDYIQIGRLKLVD
jgi:hypothetical protein